MLRLRHADGKTQPLPASACFVEMVDDETGNVAVVVYREKSGMTHVLRGNDAEAIRYAQLYGVKFCQSVDLPRKSVIQR